MEGIGEGSIFRLEVPFITLKALLAGIFREVEGLALHKHPKNTVKIITFLYCLSMLL
jgi:hypothetical protein